MKKTKLEQIKHFFSLIWLVMKLIWGAITDKRVWIAIVLLTSFYLWGWFNANYYTQSPVKVWQNVIVPRYRSTKKLTVARKVVAQTVKPTPTPNPDYELAYDTVLFRESNRGNDKSGLNGECIKLGKINQIGFAPQERPILCFIDEQDQKETFMLWLNNRLTHKKMPYCNSVNECVLFYSNQSYGI